MKILIIDDEANIRKALSGLLKDNGYPETMHCESGDEGLRAANERHFDLIFLDVKLPGMNGLEVLSRLEPASLNTAVIMISGHADLSMAVKAVRLGAYDFLEKPLNPEKVLLDVRNVARRRSMEQEVSSLKQIVDVDYQMVGNSHEMGRLQREIEKAAPSDSRILVSGENGTGKELVAREIHKRSQRSGASFVKVNCAAIPRELIESELFGHEKGAFTGAHKKKRGVFEEADGGTLFLDEIGDMALETQSRLLRVLQENEFQRVGGTVPIKFDVRIISATNKDLQNEIQQGYFREDLYFRINVIPIVVPPLRERKSDIPLLVNHFLHAYSYRNNKKRKVMDDAAMQAFKEYHWPGNIRELKNLIERLVIMTESEKITYEDVVNGLGGRGKQDNRMEKGTEFSGPLKERLMEFEKQLLSNEYRKAEGNVSKMAENLQTDRPNLHRKLKKYDIK